MTTKAVPARKAASLKQAPATKTAAPRSPAAAKKASAPAKRAPGRPREVLGGADVHVSLRMSAQQREKVRRNGGTGWVRQLIDNAPD